MGFEGKSIIITGASSGIGSDVAHHFAKLGAKVSIVGRNVEKLNEVANQIKVLEKYHPLVIVADVTQDAERIVEQTVDRFGKIDVLVNNAGFGIRDNTQEIDLSEFDRIFDTNVLSVINLTKLCVPYLEKTKGNVVNVSCIFGLKAIPGYLSYCLTKAALDQYTKCASLDLAQKRIRVNSINPGTVKTSFLRALGMSDEVAEGMYDGMRGMYPIGRLGNVSDTSNAITFLADNETASFLTGQLLVVDGGIMTRKLKNLVYEELF